jgi:signal transduction histidine kinase/DNA-binding response OmpR family regulator
LLDAKVISENLESDSILQAAKLAEVTLGLVGRYDKSQLSTLLSLGQTWVWETDAEHRFSFISKAMETATGLRVKDSIGRTRRECFFGSNAITPAMVAHLDDLENHRPFVDFVFRSSGKTQKKLWVSISGTPQFDKNGAFTGYIGVSRGLSEEAFVDSGLKNAADQLSRVETLMADIIGSVPDGIALWDKDGRLVTCNQNFREMIAVGVPFQSGETYEAIIRRIMAANQVLNIEGSIDDWLADDLRTMREDESIEDVYQLPDARWILRRVKLSPNGERVDIRTDVTEIKNTERAAKAALEEAVLAQSVVNGLDEPVFVKDADLKFVFCNDAFGAIMNRKAADFPGKRAYDFVTANEAEAFEASEIEILEKGGSYEIEEDHFDGGMQKTRILRKSRIITSSGKHYIAGYMFDITALRQRESALAAASRRATSADKAKSDFLAQMSHEIRTPMNGVLSMTELLVQSSLDERQSVFVDIIRKSGESLLATINSILDFTRIESGSLALESNPFALRTAVEDVAEMQIAKATEKETYILIDIDPALPATLTGDEGRFRQIISNLLSNAIKFTENGQIKITVKGNALTDGKFNIGLTVSDTGIGIPADKLNQIFDRFAQISISDSSKPQGTGLGLSIVAKLTGMMGGVCRVQSALHQGSTFFIDIPMDCPDTRAPTTPVSDELRAKRILIIDANAAWRECLTKPLKHWGFDVAAVENPRTALAMANALYASGQAIDLVLIGCNLPKMSCIDMGHLIDRDWPMRPATKLFLAPINAQISAQTVAQLNVHSVMTVPVKQAALYHHVTSALQAANQQSTLTAPAIPPVNPERAKASRVDVLIAEDNPVNQLVMTQILSGSGLAYQIVANGELAVEAFKDMQPSLILMDIGMPKLNGFQATKSIRSMTALGGDTVPIIAVTASAVGEDRESCLKAGMNDHLAKPISPEALLAKIAEWMPKLTRKTA